MKKASLRNLLVLIIIALIIGVVISKQGNAPAPVIPEISPVVKTVKPVVKYTPPVVSAPVSTPVVANPDRPVFTPAPIPAYLSLLTPNGNNWKRNVPNSIIWQSSRVDKVTITLDAICAPGFTCNTPAPQNGHYTIAKDIPANDTPYNWFTGKTLECGNGDTPACSLPNQQYTMKICSSTDAKVCSTKTFNLVP